MCVLTLRCFVLLQVFADGAEPVRKSLQKVFEDSSSEKSVSFQLCLCVKTYI